jgi:hypothetical protein
MPPRKIRACMRVSAKIAPDWNPPVRATRGPVAIMVSWAPELL